MLYPWPPWQEWRVCWQLTSGHWARRQHHLCSQARPQGVAQPLSQAVQVSWPCFPQSELSCTFLRDVSASQRTMLGRHGQSACMGLGCTPTSMLCPRALRPLLPGQGSP